MVIEMTMVTFHYIQVLGVGLMKKGDMVQSSWIGGEYERILCHDLVEAESLGSINLLKMTYQPMPRRRNSTTISRTDHP